MLINIEGNLIDFDDIESITPYSHLEGPSYVKGSAIRFKSGHYILFSGKLPAEMTKVLDAAFALQKK